jgi:hypothetical protein
MGASSLYERDFYAWAKEQAALLRSGELARAVIAHIAEEIESMGKTEKRELVSRLTVLLRHLLKWRFQPAGRGNSWRLSIANSRDEVVDHLGDNASLKALLADAIVSAYRYARRKASVETNLAQETFPEGCPWSFEQMVDATYWPEE